MSTNSTVTVCRRHLVVVVLMTPPSVSDANVASKQRSGDRQNDVSLTLSRWPVTHWALFRNPAKCEARSRVWLTASAERPHTGVVCGRSADAVRRALGLAAALVGLGNRA